MTTPSQAVLWPRQTRVREYRPRKMVIARRVSCREMMLACGVTKQTLDWWGTIGAFGECWTVRRSRWKTMTNETLERALLMRCLLDDGVSPAQAAELACEHVYGDRRELVFNGKDGPQTFNKAELDLL